MICITRIAEKGRLENGNVLCMTGFHEIGYTYMYLHDRKCRTSDKKYNMHTGTGSENYYGSFVRKSTSYINKFFFNRI